MKLLIMQSFPTSRHFLAFRSKYSPQELVLEHPQSVFFSSGERPSFTPTQACHTELWSDIMHQSKYQTMTNKYRSEPT